MVEAITESQALKTRWQNHTNQALVELITKTSFEDWQAHPLQALVEPKNETQALNTRWQGHLLQALVERKAKKISFEDSMANSPVPGFG